MFLNAYGGKAGRVSSFLEEVAMTSTLSTSFWRRKIATSLGVTRLGFLMTYSSLLAPSHM